MAKEYTKVVTFRLKPEQFEELEQKAKLAGRATGDLVRSAVLGLEVKALPDTKFIECLREISAQGNNLNQLSRKANEMKLSGTLTEDSFKDVMRELKEYKAVLDKLYESEA
jgi:hypothetical protein